MTVRRGEVWLADLGVTRGSEQAGTRPVIVLQNNAVNRFTSTVLTIPFTTNPRRAAPHCQVASRSAQEMAASLRTRSRCVTMRVVDVTRLKHKLGRLSAPTIEAVEACVLFTLGIDI
jgi:mRNA interferase MazF